MIEGGEYEYSLRVADDEEGLPDASLTIHVRLRNTGEVDAEVVAIQTNIRDRFDDPIAFFSSPDLSLVESRELRYPLRLAPAEVMLLDANFVIYPQPSRPLAKFAARLGEFGDDYEEFARGHVKVDIAHVDRSIREFEHEFRIALHPLRDHFINYWRSIGARDLVRLATGRSEDATTKPRESDEGQRARAIKKED